MEKRQDIHEHASVDEHAAAGHLLKNVRTPRDPQTNSLKGMSERGSRKDKNSETEQRETKGQENATDQSVCTKSKRAIDMQKGVRDGARTNKGKLQTRNKHEKEVVQETPLECNENKDNRASMRIAQTMPESTNASEQAALARNSKNIQPQPGQTPKQQTGDSGKEHGPETESTTPQQRAIWRRKETDEAAHVIASVCGPTGEHLAMNQPQQEAETVTEVTNKVTESTSETTHGGTCARKSEVIPEAKQTGQTKRPGAAPEEAWSHQLEHECSREARKQAVAPKAEKCLRQTREELDMLELNTQECQNVRSPIHKNAKELKQKRTQVSIIYRLNRTQSMSLEPQTGQTRRQSTHALPSHLTHTTPALQRQLTAYDQLQIGMNEVSQTKNDYTKHAALTATCSPQGGPLLPFALQLRPQETVGRVTKIKVAINIGHGLGSCLQEIYYRNSQRANHTILADSRRARKNTSFENCSHRTRRDCPTPHHTERWQMHRKNKVGI